MFSFHKPKIYRSNLGCCICKAKSSSSRFTDSKKYENEFERCFRIEEKRSGEICNACVLLVKRWKKLSPENRLTKHWHHVVDARAGPGTKLSGNRRLVSSTGHHHHSMGHHSNTNDSIRHHQSTGPQSCSFSQSASSSPASSSASNTAQAAASRLDVLPLSSSQAGNQSSSASCSGATINQISHAGGKRKSSFSKALAIDTNVSTFTFGEPKRARYFNGTNDSSTFHSAQSSYSSISSSSSTPSSSYWQSKPQSALSSSAFESVMKRFRQRQEQQLLKAQRRQQSRQYRQQQQHQPSSSAREPKKRPGSIQSSPTSKLGYEEDLDKDKQSSTIDESVERQQQHCSVPTGVSATVAKRQKRSSESIGSLTIDGFRVSSLLDASIWRKERICCGIIFRGLHNEIAAFPRLLKPCEAHQQPNKKLAQNEATARAADTDEGVDEEETSSPAPPPRTAKSGSISSCDSNTSGTGSMEQTFEPAARAAFSVAPPISSSGGRAQRRKSAVTRPQDLEVEQQTKEPLDEECASGDAKMTCAFRRLDKKETTPVKRSMENTKTKGRAPRTRSSHSVNLQRPMGTRRQQQQQRLKQQADINSPSESSQSSSSLISGLAGEADDQMVGEDEDDGVEMSEESPELIGVRLLLAAHEEEDTTTQDSNTDASSSVESLVSQGMGAQKAVG